MEISTDLSRLDLDFIHAFLTQTYWAQERTREAVEKSIRHSLNFGLYLDGTQVGYGRVVTDYTVFAYLMDVFIAEAHRGKGYGQMLIQFILDQDLLRHVETWRLATTDAQELYARFGFRPLAHPEKMMEQKRR